MNSAAGGGAGEPLLQHLQHIPQSPPPPDESLATVFTTLWTTRKTGLNPTQKTHIQSLLALPNTQHLDPVLACLRLLIRKSIQDRLSREDIQKLFPTSISIELKRIIMMLLQKFHGQWKDEASRGQPLWQRTSNQIRVNAPVALASFPVSDVSSTLWPRQDDATTCSNSNGVDSSVPSHAASNLPHTDPMPLNGADGSFDNLATLPRLKSMTWTMQNRHSAPANRVAIITLKLQDYSESPSGEREVKFQISKDKLEATLRSMAYISDQLTNLVPPPTGLSSEMQMQL